MAFNPYTQQMGIPEGYRLVRDPNYQPSQYGGQRNLSSINQPTIPGRFVTSEADIMPHELPADGQVAIFPRGDYQEIYAKQINRNNGVDTVVYVPKPKEEPQPAQNTVVSQVDLTPVNARLDNVENTLKRLLAIWEPQDTNRPAGGSTSNQ